MGKIDMRVYRLGNFVRVGVLTLVEVGTGEEMAMV